jgi:hypothetical protein
MNAVDVYPVSWVFNRVAREWIIPTIEVVVSTIADDHDDPLTDRCAPLGDPVSRKIWLI